MPQSPWDTEADMPNPFAHWPETMPAMMDAHERVRRAAWRRRVKTVVSVLAFWAACGWIAMAVVDALRGMS